MTSRLLQLALTDFAMAAGSVRRDYGVLDWAHGAGAGSANVRHGVSETFTVDGHVEVASCR